MGIEHLGRDPHWNYYLALEEDIENLSRWVEFAEANHATFSIEIARILMTAAAEADVVAKMICGKLVPDQRAGSIGKYQKIILGAYPDLPQARVYMPRFNMKFTPWAEWSEVDSPPMWWSANNKVKHHRQANFNEANLKNALNAAAGLLLLLAIHYDGLIQMIRPAPKVFHPRAYAFAREDGMQIQWSKK